MIGPGLVMFLLSQAVPTVPTIGWAKTVPLEVGKTVMVIPHAAGRWQTMPFFEQRGTRRCILHYTYSTDAENYERMVVCTMPGFPPSAGPDRQIWTTVECAGKGCEP